MVDERDFYPVKFCFICVVVTEKFTYRIDNWKMFIEERVVGKNGAQVTGEAEKQAQEMSRLNSRRK